jgi:cyclic pyranopterin phosphate synthase
MPAEVFGENYTFLPRAEILTFEEIERLVWLFVGLGVRKIRITGGEPLLRREIEALIRRLAAVDGIEDLTLTTNGYLLPKKAGELKAAGLHRITVSLDSLDEDVFELLNGRGYHVSQVLEGIREAEAAGFSPLKINAVIQRGVNDHTIVDLARHFYGTGHIVRFIEYMDVGNRNGWRLDQVVPAAEIVQRIHEEMPVTAIAPNYPGEVARRFRYLDGSGEIGVIASVTQPFCGDCTRARLSTDGKVYTCLFAETGMDLRGPLRDGASNDELLATISEIWEGREDRYSELRTASTSEMPSFSKVEMYQIGG